MNILLRAARQAHEGKPPHDAGRALPINQPEAYEAQCDPAAEQAGGRCAHVAGQAAGCVTQQREQHDPCVALSVDRHSTLKPSKD